MWFLLKAILRNSLIISTVLFALLLTYVNYHPQTYAQTNVKTFKFLNIFINLTKDGNVQQFASSQKTISGTDAQLRTAFAALVKQQNYQNKNVVSTTFIGDDNKTQEVYGKGKATPAVFDHWFNTMLTPKMVAGKIIATKTTKVWITICSGEPAKCATTHGTLTQPQVQ